MMARVLHEDEWDRLSEIPMPAWSDYVRPEDTQVVVVESGGRIVASMTVLRMTHAENAWVHPEHCNAGVVRALLRKVGEAARDWSAGWVVMSATDDRTRDIIKRMKGAPVPVETFLVGVR